ncbi:MAG: hypothetical protein HQL52_15945 [Magnetococcales bacterium]|nr:hypothetical protein [Magnetococcales bacterium]
MKSSNFPGIYRKLPHLACATLLSLAPISASVQVLPKTLTAAAVLASTILLPTTVFASGAPAPDVDKEVDPAPAPAPAPVVEGDKDKDSDKAKDKSNRKAITNPSGKVTVCHKAGNSGKFVEITIDDSALPAHMAHDGDYIGVCANTDQIVERRVIGCKEPYLTTLIEELEVKDITTEDGAETSDVGLYGGHFDLDTSTSIVGFGTGSTNKHVHEWDDKHDETRINFFDMLDSGFDNIQDTIDADQQFIITVANTAYSKGGVLSFNGANEDVADHEEAVDSLMDAGTPLTVYKIGTPTSEELANNVKQLNSFTLTFDVNAILSGGLIPTNTGCVKDNDAGPNGEYRNGALLVQALKADDYAIHEKGYATTGLLWEATVFWHWDPSECFHDAGWQAAYNQCLLTGDCLSASKKRQKKDASNKSDNEKICICHKAGKSGKYVKIEVSDSAACAHLGWEPEADGSAKTPNTCVPTGHDGDTFVGWKPDVNCKSKTVNSCPDDEPEITVEETTETYTQAVEDCIDPEKGGGYLGSAETGRINWKQIIED